MKPFDKLVIAFQEDTACKEPYYLGFTFQETNYVLIGEFFKPTMQYLSKNRILDWGAGSNEACGSLSEVLLEDVLEDGDPDMDRLIVTLEMSLKNFPKKEGLAWLIWKEDLLKWTRLPRFGIIPRLGNLKFDENKKILIIGFPVPGVTFSQVGR